jgi:hypothetical protein
MSGRRIATRVAFGFGVAAATLSWAAAPALGATGSLTVTPGGTISSPTTVHVSGKYNNSNSANSTSLRITVDNADGSSSTLYSGSARGFSSGTTPTQSFDTSGVVNGNYTFTFAVGGSAVDSQQITLRVPPAQVQGFGGSASSTVAHFTWSPNSENDLAGYDIVDTTSGRTDLTPGGIDASACSSSSCSVDVDFGSSAAGTSRTFVIDALRYTSPSHNGTVASSDSSPATINFPAPTTPTPTQSSGGSTGSSGGSHGSGGSGTPSSGSTGSTGGSTGGSSSSTGGGGSKSGSTAGTSKGSISSSHPNDALRAYLPSTTAGAAPDLPSVVTEVQPLPEGTYKPTLAYPDQLITSSKQTKGNQAIATVRTELVHVLNMSALWKSLAGAVLLLLVAAHLRAWVSSADMLDR